MGMVVNPSRFAVTGGGGGAPAGVRYIRFANASNDSNLSVTFSAAPLVGDWIVALVFYSSTAGPSVASGWTEIGRRNDGNGRSASVMAYRQVQVGDTATVTPWGSPGSQKYNMAWCLRPSDVGASWTDIFGEAKLSYGNTALANFALDVTDDWLVLAGLHARASGSAPTVGSDWVVNANFDDGPLNRRNFSGRKISATGAIDMSTLVNNPSTGEGGICAIALRYTAVDELPPVATDYLQDISTGNRNGIIGFTNNGIEGFGDFSALLNGNTGENSFFFYNRSNDNWQYFQFDFGIPRIINGFKWYQSFGTWQGAWRMHGSNDGSTWDDLSGADLGLDNGEFLFTNATAYQYYRLWCNGGSRSSGPYLREIEFKAAPA